MRILFVTPDFYPRSTGFANASINLIDAILSNGKNMYEVYIFTHTQLNGSQELQNGANIFRYRKEKHPKPLILYFEKKEYKELKRLIDENNIDVIFFETNTFPFLQYWTLLEYGSKVFVRIHSTADTEVLIYGKHQTLGAKIAYILTRKFMYGVNNILATSDYYIDFVKQNYLDGNVYSIWNNKSYGVLYNTSIIESIEVKDNPANNTFITMGKLSDNGLTQKGIPDLLKSIYYVKTFGQLKEDFKLIIIGDGKKLPLIKKMIIDLDLSESVELIQSAPHDVTLRLISSSKAIILLSRYEGQSMFITESLSLGKPIIVSDNNGMQDMIQDGKNGIVVKTGDPISAAKAIIKVMEMDSEALRKMGQSSANLYEEKFSGRAIYQQFNNAMKLRIK